jgi:hypothetical protein
LNGSLTAMAGVMATAVASFQLWKKATDLFADYEAKVTAVNAALAATNQLSQENSRTITELADKYQQATTIADDEWFEVQGKLIRQGRVHINQLEQEMKVVENLAGLMGTSVTEAANAYTKALQGNFSLLQRHGIQVSDQISLEQQLASVRAQAARGEGILAAATETAEGRRRLAAQASADALRNLGAQVFNDDFYRGLRVVSDWAAELFGNARVAVEHLKNRGIDPAAESARILAEDLRAVGFAVAEIDEQGLTKIKSAAEQAADKTKQLADNLERIRRETDETAEAELAQKLGQLALDEEAAISADPQNERSIRAKFSAARGRARSDFEIEKTKRELDDQAKIQLQAGQDKATAEQLRQRAAGRVIEAKWALDKAAPQRTAEQQQAEEAAAFQDALSISQERKSIGPADRDALADNESRQQAADNRLALARGKGKERDDLAAAEEAAAKANAEADKLEAQAKENSRQALRRIENLTAKLTGKLNESVAEQSKAAREQNQILQQAKQKEAEDKAKAEIERQKAIKDDATKSLAARERAALVIAQNQSGPQAYVDAANWINQQRQREAGKGGSFTPVTPGGLQSGDLPPMTPPKAGPPVPSQQPDEVLAREQFRDVGAGRTREAELIRQLREELKKRDQADAARIDQLDGLIQDLRSREKVRS